MSSEPASSGQLQPPNGSMPFDVFATRVLYVVALGVGCLSKVQGDLWWLLRAGKDIWHTQHVSLVDHFSSTAAGRYWPNHEWLWEVIAYALHAVGGLPLLTAVTGLTIAATVVVLRHVVPVTGYVVPIVMGAALPLMSITWTIRPEVTSLLLLAVTLFLVTHDRVVWIPPMFLLWANLHGEVAVGGVLLAVITVGAVAEALRFRTPEARVRASRLTVVLAASALATLATPLRGRLWTYVLGAGNRPQQNRIAEWATAFHLTVPAVLLWVPLVGAIILGILRRDRLASWSTRVPAYAACSMVPLALLAVRNVPFFVAAAVPLYLVLLEFHPRTPIGRVPRARTILVGGTVATAAAVATIWVAAPQALQWTPVSDRLAEAVRSCPGQLYNDYDEGAALVWWVPDVAVFVDNRQDPYPADVVDAAGGLDAMSYPAVFQRWHIRCAMVPASEPLEAALLHDGWRTTYSDGSTTVLVPSSPRATDATK